MTIEIHCPWHGKLELIEIPDGYLDFEGEVLCTSAARAQGPAENLYARGPFVVNITLAEGEVLKVSRASP